MVNSFLSGKNKENLRITYTLKDICTYKPYRKRADVSSVQKFCDVTLCH